MRDWVLHPFFLGALPILSLVAQNLDEDVHLSDAIRPLGIVLGMVAAFMLLGALLFREPRKVGLVLSVWIVLFFSYGYVWGAQGEEAAAEARSYLVPVLLWGSLAVGAVFLVARARSLLPLTRSLNLVTAALVAINLFPILTYSPGRLPEEVDALPPLTSAAGPSERRLPDIYYLVFDRYARQDTLRQTFGYDNRPFLRWLSARGFFVATSSVANYPKTSHSLASSLNMRYLDFLKGKIDGRSLAPAYRLIRRNRVVEFLKGQGYRFVLVGSGWSPTNASPMADAVWNYKAGSEFSSALFDTTILQGFGEDLGPLSRALDRRTVRWHRTLFQIDQVARSRDLAGPKFVLAHFLVPHTPYVFDREGRFVSRKEEGERDWRDLYVEQLIFTNQRIKELVDHLLSGPDHSDPIIILQADEGPHPEAIVGQVDTFSWHGVSDSDMKLKFGILNAYHLPPGAGKEKLYSSITPVNTFRVVLDAYFGLDLATLPDRSYVFPDYGHLYQFTDITERLRG